MKTVQPFGSWKSPVTPEYVAGKERALTMALQVDLDDLYFLEYRPDQSGRSALMVRELSGKVREVLPPEFDVRTRYLEYGGLAFHISQGTCYFINFSDQQIYSCPKNGAPLALTKELKTRFADLTLDPKRRRLIGLREILGEPQSRNTICAIDLDSGAVTDLIQGADFYNSPRLNATGDKLLWLSWEHPNMAWNGTQLWSADLEASGKIGTPNKIAGDSEHGVCQPCWGPKNEIYYIHEADEWFNLYCWSDGASTPLFARAAEFALPDWVPGTRQFAVAADGSVYATFLEHGRWRIVVGRPGEEPRLSGERFAQVPALQAYRNSAVAIVGRSTRPLSVEAVDRNAVTTELYSSPATTLPTASISVAEEVQFPTDDGGTGYAWYYPPVNEKYVGPAGERPPLQVRCHGGPTSAAYSDFKKDIQFWTSRGYAVVDVNYGGSTGRGRAYRERLRGKWGLVDVADCVAVVKKLSLDGRIDPKRVAIRGGSAGGYTTLAALAFTQNIFSAGASYFGVSELELLAKETHKLESRYLDQLVGPYPEALATYKERSPIDHSEALKCPIIFFQGDEDRVVPPNQSALMHESLKKRGIATEYHLYKKEGHGFRRAETIQNSLLAEHAFYARFFGFRAQAEDFIT